MEFNFLKMETIIRVNIHRINFREKEHLYGIMDHHIKVHLFKIKNKDMENGNQLLNN
jgi:hypothetical protein